MLRRPAVSCVVALLLTASACTNAPSPPRVTAEVNDEPSAPKPLPRASVEQPSLPVREEITWLAFGGGSEPLTNQISLAQDVALVSQLLAPPGLVLFASGPGAQLAVERQADDRDTLSLARVLSPPENEQTEYRSAKMHIDGPATSEHVRDVLRRSLTLGEAPLFLYGACHGSPGDTPAENHLNLWGGWSLSVRDVAQLLDDPERARPTRLVITACFGGGFADVIFRNADPERGLREGDHCGLFATTWDDEASGCDPNPDRRTQESYSIHFLHALAGRDRRDRPSKDSIDLNRDGAIDLLEAHTHARIQSHSFDVPTTTSERYLRVAFARAGGQAKLNPLAAPEEAHVIKALGEELSLDSERQARAKLEELDQIQRDANGVMQEAQKDADDSYYALRIALLERWPLLEHPWEQRTQGMLRREGPSITRMLRDSELAQAHAQGERELSEALAQHEGIRVARARVSRLVRAFETLRLASLAYEQGGEIKARYDALRRCERWAPPLRSERGR